MPPKKTPNPVSSRGKTAATATGARSAGFNEDDRMRAYRTVKDRRCREGSGDGVAVESAGPGDDAVERDLGGAAERLIRLTILTADVERGDSERRLGDGEGSRSVGDGVIRKIGTELPIRPSPEHSPACPPGTQSWSPTPQLRPPPALFATTPSSQPSARPAPTRGLRYCR
jgi:hypothetical protein